MLIQYVYNTIGVKVDSTDLNGHYMIMSFVWQEQEAGDRFPAARAGRRAPGALEQAGRRRRHGRRGAANEARVAELPHQGLAGSL